MSLRHSDFFTYISEKVILSLFLKFLGFLCSIRILICLPIADIFINNLSVISWTMKIPFVCYLHNTAHLQAPKEQFLIALRKYTRSLLNQFLWWINEMKHWTLIIKGTILHLKTWGFLWDCKKNLLIQVNFLEN